jgi:D-alanyl-lipoteichoic acid acyltransferase DltB (MBOAT superfamily)
MTLSRWLRDYLYIPLGGNHGSRHRTYRNLMITMLLGGLWHGAAWTFVVWGGIHGGGLALERWWRERKEPPSTPAREPDPEPVLVGIGGVTTALLPSSGTAAEPEERTKEEEPRYEVRGVVLSGGLRMWARRVVVFHVVCLAWVFFRATSMRAAFEVLGRIAFHGSTTAINGWVVVVVAGMLLAQLVPVRTVQRVQVAISRWSVPAQASALAFVLIVVDVLGPTGVAPFIYFQF